MSEIDAAVAVRPLESSHGRAWDAFVASHPRGTVYHSLSWKRVLEDAFPLEPRYLVAVRGADIVGVLPIARQRSMLFGKRHTSLPFCTYGGPLAYDPGIERTLLDAAAADVAADGSSYLEVRDQRVPALPPDPGGGTWSVSSRKVGTVVRTDAPPDILRQRIEKSRRYDLRTAEKHCLEFVMRPAAEGVDSFYRIFARSMRDLGTPVYPRGFFDALAAHLGDVFSFAFALHEGRPVAAALIGSWRDMLEIPLMGALRSHRSMAPSAYLYWKLMEHASLSGLAACDFGRSTRGSGTHAFKVKFGGVDRELPWLYFVPENHTMPSLHREESGMQALVHAWQRCPLWLTNALGPHIAKRLY